MGIGKISLLAAVAAAAMVAAVGANAKEAKTIGLAGANLQANFFNQIKESVEAEGAAKGIKIITVDAKGDAATQVNQIQDLLAQNIDALIYIPAGATAAPFRSRPRGRRACRSSMSIAMQKARPATRSLRPTALHPRSRSAPGSPGRPAARARC